MSQATLNSLALPKKARIQQQVTHSLHDVTDFATWKAAQLAKRRRFKQHAGQLQQRHKEAEREALQGWQREKEQVGGLQQANPFYKLQTCSARCAL